MTGPDVALVFAAGFGTRMGALTRDRPKPLIPVAGKALLDHALDRVAEAGVAHAVVNTHYLHGQIRTHVARRSEPAVSISHEADEVLETGGGLRQALPLLGEGPIFALNADAVWTGANPLGTLAKAWGADGVSEVAEAMLLLVPRENATGHTSSGDFDLEPTGRLRRRGEAATAPYVYTGAQIIATDRIAEREPGVFSLNPIWDEMIAEGRLFGCVHAGGWADVGTPEGIDLAEAMLEVS